MKVRVWCVKHVMQFKCVFTLLFTGVEGRVQIYQCARNVWNFETFWIADLKSVWTGTDMSTDCRAFGTHVHPFGHQNQPSVFPTERGQRSWMQMVEPDFFFLVSPRRNGLRISIYQENYCNSVELWADCVLLLGMCGCGTCVCARVSNER